MDLIINDHMKTIYQLQQIAARLREVTEVNSISPEDTFGLQADVLEYLADMEQNAEGLGIHKVYASYAAMVADASAPVGSNGKALRFGQLVVIYDSSNTTQAESGNVYAWQKGNTGAAAWLLMGNLGSMHALQSQIDSLLSSDESLKGQITELNGSMLDEVISVEVGKTFSQYFDFHINAGTEVAISIENNKMSTIAIILCNETGETVQSLGNVKADDLPMTIITNSEVHMVRFAAWSASWITTSGDMNVKVSSKGNIDKLEKGIKHNYSLINSVETDIIGESVLEYAIDVKGKYISTSGTLRDLNISIVTKPVHIMKGTVVRMVVNDTGFALIAKKLTDTTYEPVYIYEKKNSEKFYTFEEDMEVCFTVIEGSIINLLNGNGLSKEVAKLKDSEKKTEYYTSIVGRNEASEPFVKKVTGIASNSIIDVHLLKDISYVITNNSADNSSLSIFVYDKATSSYVSILVSQLLADMSVVVKMDEDVESIIVISSGDIYFDIIRKETVSSVKDNLQSDGNIIGISNILKGNNISKSFYGQDGARYEFDVKNNFKNLYLYFEWQAQTVLQNTGKPVVLAKALNGVVRSYFLVEGAGITPECNIYRKTFWGTKKDGAYASSAGLTPPSQQGNFNQSYFNYAGSDALWIRYKGNGSAASMKMGENNIIFIIDGTEKTVSIFPNESLTTLIARINATDYAEAGAVECGNYIYDNLLKDTALSIPLISTFTSSTDINIKDAPRIYIPLANDTRWHSYELLVDVENKKMYENHDGFTKVSDIDASVDDVMKLSTSKVSIGDLYNDGNTPLRFRNLELEVGSCGSAEIIEARCPIPNANGVYDRRGIEQMISNHNPRVVLYEGHGILVGTDADYPASEGESFVSERSMSCTTDRLMKLFAYAKSKGYEFVTWQDVVDWKIKGKPLPKRCMNLMFDDFRVENYIDYDKRIPFNKFGIKPSLCIITNRDLDATFECNGKTYTNKEALNYIRNAGWYLTSHSHDHRNQDEQKPSEQIDMFKEDALSADVYGVGCEVVTYGGANLRFYELSALKASSFVMGINGMNHDYICKGVNNFYINRCDVGLRLNWEQLIAPLA